MTSDADRTRFLETFLSMRADALPSLAVAREDDLQVIHTVILQTLDREPDRTVKELAVRIDRSVSQTSRLVEHLVRRGLVERREDDADRRVRRVRVSAPGAALLEKLDRIRSELLTRLWDSFTDEERPVVLQSMEAFANAMKRLKAEEERP